MSFWYVAFAVLDFCDEYAVWLGIAFIALVALLSRGK